MVDNLMKNMHKQVCVCVFLGGGKEQKRQQTLSPKPRKQRRIGEKHSTDERAVPFVQFI